MRNEQRYKLKNGLEVYLKKVNDRKTISCGIWFNQGSKDESIENNGLSHLVEHLMFKIKSKETELNMDEILNNLSKIGTFYSGVTSKDNTGFYVEGFSSDVEIFLKFLLYLVVNKEKVNIDDLEKEKEVVLREAEEHFMSSAQMEDRIGQALWGDSSFGNMVVGNYNNIKNISCDMVDELIKNAYTPDNSALVIVGEFEFDEIKKLIERIFGNWKGKCTKNNKHTLQIKPKLIVDDRFKGDRTTFGIGFSGYPITDIRFQYLEILKNILVNVDSNLVSRLRKEKGLVYSLKGFSDAFSEAGYIGLTFSANNKDIEEIVKICVEEFRNIVQDGVDLEVFESLKRKRLLEVLFSSQSSTQEIIAIGDSILYGETYSLDKYIKDIQSLTKEKMDCVIKEIFKNENLCAVSLGCADMSKIKDILRI